MRVRRILAFIAILASVISTPLTAKIASGSASDETAIRAVIEGFRVGIITRDKTALNGLAVSPSITFLASIDPETFARLRVRRTSAKRLVPGTYPAFVDDIVSAKTQSEEVFDEIVIHQDGSVGAVYFNYKFKEDGVVTNWGHESWGLVATGEGWRISSIIYSLNFPPAHQG